MELIGGLSFLGNFLNNRDINRLGLTCQTYFILSNSNAIWKPIYDDLMKDKLIEFNTSFISRLLKCNINYKYKYYITLWDSKREFITLDELIEAVMINGMDPNYEITRNGKPTGEMVIDLIQF